MSERERERLYWRLSLIFAAASPLSIYFTSKAGYSPSFHHPTFLVILFSAIPLGILIDLLIATLFARGATRVWVVRPTAQAGRALSMTVGQGVAAIASRLEGAGFAHESSEGEAGSLIRFGKAKSQPVGAFLDHAFFGEVSVKPFESGASAACRVTFDDTLIVDTGEREKLQALCDFILLKSAEFTYENVPFTLICGLCLSLTTAAFTLTGKRVIGDASLTCLSLAAAGLLAGGLFHLLKDRTHLFGFRLFFVGIYLAAIPFNAKLAALFVG